MKEFSQIFDDGWKVICNQIYGSVLFLDDAAAESLHWHGGLNRVLEAGVVAVRNFSVFEKVSPAFKKAAFVITSPLSDSVLKTLMVLIQSNNFRSCLLVSCLPLNCCDAAKNQADQISYMEDQLLDWMGNMNYSAEVLYVPVNGLSLLENVFIVPSLSKSFLSLVLDLLPDENNKEGLKSLPEGVQRSVKALSSCLSSLLDELYLGGDIFSLGPLSHIVGLELENLCHSSKKTYQSKASVILIDRSLDLTGPLSQNSETPVSKMLRLLPNLPGHVCDVQVDMSDVAQCNSDTVFDLPLLAPGCIAQRNNSTENENLNILFNKRFKEAVMEMNRSLVKIGINDGLTFDSVSTSASKGLKKRILKFKENPQLLYKHCGVLQQCLAMVEVLEHPKNAHLDNLLATEKLLLQNFAVSETEVSADINRLIANHKERGYKMKDVLTLISVLYALSDGHVLDVESEAAIQASIMETLFQDDVDTVELVRNLAGEDANDDDILASVKSLFDVLRNFSDFRKDFKKFKSLFESSDPALPKTYTPLLKQVLESIFKSLPIPDMEFHSAGLRDYIKTGFSLFMNVAKPQPKDNSVVIIFVIGGITASEIKLARDMVQTYKAPKVFLGSTTVLTPEKTMDDIFSVVRDLSELDDSLEGFY